MLINEVKAIKIRVGDIYTLNADIGTLKAGEKVTVRSIRPVGDDIELTLFNQNGIEDVFYLDKNDDFEELT